MVGVGKGGGEGRGGRCGGELKLGYFVFQIST